MNWVIIGSVSAPNHYQNHCWLMPINPSQTDSIRDIRHLIARFREVLTRSREIKYKNYHTTDMRPGGSAIEKSVKFQNDWKNENLNIVVLRFREIWFETSRFYFSRWSQWAHDVMITSLLRQNDVTTSFWRNTGVIIASCVLWDYFSELWLVSLRDSVLCVTTESQSACGRENLQYEFPKKT